jgi:hypothetical protein
MRSSEILNNQADREERISEGFFSKDVIRRSEDSILEMNYIAKSSFAFFYSEVLPSIEPAWCMLLQHLVDQRSISLCTSMSLPNSLFL